MAKFDSSKAMDEQRMETQRIINDFANNTTIKLEKIDLTQIQNIDVTELYSAPKEWNYYDKLSEDKMYELMDSISDNGLMSPIIVWKVNKCEIFKSNNETDKYDFYGEDYLILSGHNRVKAYFNLYDATKKERYVNIPAFVFETITEFQARNIIIDSNYAQRDLSTSERVKSIIDKYHVYEKEKISKGKIAEFIASDLDITPRTVFNYKKLASLNHNIKDMVYSDNLPLTAALKLANISNQTQEWLYDEKRDYITPKVLNKIKPNSSKKDVQRIIDDYDKSINKEVSKITISVPAELEEKFKIMCKNWIYDNSKRDR